MTSAVSSNSPSVASPPYTSKIHLHHRPQILRDPFHPPSDIYTATEHKPNMPHHTQPPQSLIHLSLNQDHGCFAAGTASGFCIYNCNPLREKFRRNFTGGVVVVQMLFRCNIIALVGQHSPKKVMIWDYQQGRCIVEQSFPSEVKSVRLRRERIVVILLQNIYVYNFADLRLLHQIETDSNPKGLCEVSHVSGELMILACPGSVKGQVRVEHYGPKRTKFITAHDSRLATFALTNEGRLLATSSSKGTLVRVFSTQDGSLLQEVRRGVDRVEIYSIAFSRSAQWLAVSGDKGTVHVFRLNVVDSARVSSPKRSYIRSRVLPRYFSSEWSVARFRLVQDLHNVVAFGHQDNTVVILGMDGSFYLCEFNPVSGGEMILLEHDNILKPEDNI